MKMKTLVKPELLNLYATNSDTEKITYLKVDENISKESLIKDFKRNKPPYWLSCKKEAVCIVCDENEIGGFEPAMIDIFNDNRQVSEG